MKFKILSLLLLFGWMSIILCSLSGCKNEADNRNTEIITTEVVVNESTETRMTTEVPATEQVRNYSDYEIILTSNNNWENNGMISAQYEGIIKNASDTTGKDWKVTITVPANSRLEDAWNGNYNLKETTLEITPVEYNQEIAIGGELSFGFILSTPDEFLAEKVVLNIGSAQYVMREEENANPDTIDSLQEDEKKEEQKEIEEVEKVTEREKTETAFSNHGTLSIKGTEIVDKDGKIFQLKGISTHGINWFPEYVNKEAFEDLTSYGVNAIRLAMYTADYNGYCSGGNQEELEQIVHNGVQYCTELGMYVIIDWHILNDKNPNQNKEAAKQFFEKMSKKYANQDNIIYEICNEPNGDTRWEDIKAYAEEVIPVIRNNDKNALIIVGTPNWSQDVDIASTNPITGYDNILYAAHFYAATHKEDLRNKVKTAIQNGLPVIISECNISEASGDGTIDYEEGQKWMELIHQYHLSCFAWSLGNKDETASLLKSSVTKQNGFVKDDFSETGKWYLDQYSK